VPNGIDIAAQSKAHWDAYNKELMNYQYYATISGDKNGNVTNVVPYGTTAYTVQYDVEVKVFNDENSEDFKAYASQSNFAGVYLIGEGDFLGAKPDWGPTNPAETVTLDGKTLKIGGSSQEVELRRKEAVFFKNATTFNKQNEVHEDGHTLGLDHQGLNTVFAQIIPSGGGYSNRIGFPFIPIAGGDNGVPGYNWEGMMQYGGATGSQAMTGWEFINILQSNPGTISKPDAKK